MLTWLSENWLNILVVVSGVVAGASVALHAISPLTKTERDDNIYKWLVKVEGWLQKLSLNKSSK